MERNILRRIETRLGIAELKRRFDLEAQGHELRDQEFEHTGDYIRDRIPQDQEITLWEHPDMLPGVDRGPMLDQG